MNRKEIFSRATPYLLSIFTTAVCLGVSMVVFVWLGKPSGLILFLPAILASGWYGGFWSGVGTTLLSVVCVYYFFVPPYSAFFGKSIVTIIQLVLFLGEGIIVSSIIDYGHRQEKIANYKKREKEQQERVLELEDKLAYAQKQIASRDEFLSIASHELKTPLTTVLLQIQTSLHNIRNVSLAEFSVEHLVQMLQSTQTQTKRLARMINDLLNISLITTHRLELEIDDVDLTTLVRDIVENSQGKFERAGSTISFDAHESILGKWDKLRIEQAIENIISNAYKYGNKKPVTVTLRKKDGMAVLSVTDHGIGIPKNQREKIFHLFERGTTDKAYKGLGVGLYIASQIVTMHKGTIELQSNMGDGTTFTVNLPIQS